MNAPLHLVADIEAMKHRDLSLGILFRDQQMRQYVNDAIEEEFPFTVRPPANLFDRYPRCTDEHKLRREWLAEQGITEYVSYEAGAYKFKHDTQAAMFKLRWS